MKAARCRVVTMTTRKGSKMEEHNSDKYNINGSLLMYINVKLNVLVEHKDKQTCRQKTWNKIASYCTNFLVEVTDIEV
jgi:hypothetical protein